MSEDGLSRNFSSLFEFLDNYRTDIQDGYLAVPADGEFEAGVPCNVTVTIPVFDEEFELVGEIVDVQEEGVVLRLDEEDDGFQRMEWLFDLSGRFIEEMLATGRFKIMGAPATASAAPPPSVGVEDQMAGSDAPGAPAPAPAPPPAASPPAATSDGVTPGVEPSASGELDAKILRGLLMDCYRQQFTGVMRVDHPLGTSTVFFDKGGPVQVRDDPVVVEECLGVLLVRAGRITEPQFKKSLEMMNETGKLQGECLIDMGLLNFPVLVMALMRQAEVKVLRLYEQAEGSYALYPLARHRTKFVTPPLKIPAVLYKSLKETFINMPAKEIAEQQAPLMDMYSKVVMDFPEDDLQLKRSEKEFLEILGKRSWRMRQIGTVSNMGRQPTLVNTMTLIELGILQFVQDEDLSQIHGTIKEKLRVKLAGMIDQNHFERLELHWSARDNDVKEGYERLVKEWKGLGSGQELPGDLEASRGEVLQHLKESYGILQDRQSRQNYRREIYEEQQIQFSADIFFRQSEMLIIKKKWAETRENLERAVELRPDNRKYVSALQALENKIRE